MCSLSNYYLTCFMRATHTVIDFGGSGMRTTPWVAALILGTWAMAADTSSTTPPPAVTFNKDVLPFLQKNCQSCHRPGQIAPMSFLSYESTRPWAKAMKAAVASKKMPPWGADPKFGHFTNDRSLRQSDIDMI